MDFKNPKILASGFNTLASSRKRGLKKQQHQNARGFAWELLCSCMGYKPGWSVKRRGKSSRVHSKKNFLVGGAGFLSVTS